MNKQIAEAANKLKAGGIRLTTQRQLILEHLYNHLTHPSAEELYQSIFQVNPHYVSMTTIYNTLRTLKKHGMVKEFYLQRDGVSRYDINMKPHHHLICEACGCISDYELPLSPFLMAGTDQSFRAERYYIEFSGLCLACEQQKPQSGSVSRKKTAVG
ncbi:Fur family transcriptional regulator [Paenibacillus sambharensis]|nr:transcriptional repressor [Paenibacillus sambharensis]